jgi:hypothetical protein
MLLIGGDPTSAEPSQRSCQHLRIDPWKPGANLERSRSPGRGRQGQLLHERVVPAPVLWLTLAM